MNKVCVGCKKEFTPKKETRAYCSLKCYQDRNKPKEVIKFDLGQFLFDGAQIIVPILIISFCMFCIVPKDIVMVQDDEIKLVKDIPNSSCDDFEFEIDEIQDGLYLDYIRTGR